jgi:DNA-binding NarL/FixJ family response regulator
MTSGRARDAGAGGARVGVAAGDEVDGTVGGGTLGTVGGGTHGAVGGGTHEAVGDEAVGDVGGEARVVTGGTARGAMACGDVCGAVAGGDLVGAAEDVVRVALADDHALLRASFRLLIDHTPGLLCVGEAANGREAVEVAHREKPDVILMDVRMPEMSGIEATQEICRGASGLATRVIVLTTFDLDEYVFGAIRAGASGFLLKEVLPDELIRAIRVVAAGEALLTPAATRRLITAYVSQPERQVSPLPDITARELEVLELIARGRSNEEIAAELHVSIGTVKSHISRLLTKLDARDRAQLVVAAYEAGLR